MRPLLTASILLSILLVLGWLWLGDRTVSADTLEVQPVSPVATAGSEPEESLVAVSDFAAAAPEETRTIAAVEPKEEASIARPNGFSQLVVRVLVGERPIAGAKVELPKGVDALLNGPGDDEGRGVTNAKGQVRFFVRPTRTAVIKAQEPNSSKTVEGTFTTPFEHRSRVVELRFGADADLGVPLLILSELGGTPLPGALVEVIDAEEGMTTEVIADATGLASVRGEVRLKYRISFPGFVTETLRRVGLETEADGFVAVRLRPYAHVHGQIAETFPGRAQRRMEAPGSQDDPFFRAAITDMGFEPRVSFKRERSEGLTQVKGVRFTGGTGVVRGNPGAKVNPDGTWSTQIAIPKGESQWESLRVVYQGNHGSNRTLATIGVLRPGDHITIDDPWTDAHPLALVFEDTEGQPIAVASGVLLSREPVHDGQTDTQLWGLVDREGGLDFPKVPLGKWFYRVDVPGAPPSWALEGTIQHEGGDEPIRLSHDAKSLVVRLPKATSWEGVGRRLRLGVAKSGELPVALRKVSEGGSVTFPHVPAGEAWDLVLVEHRLVIESDGLQRAQPNYDGAIRVPIHTGEREIVMPAE